VILEEKILKVLGGGTPIMHLEEILFSAASCEAEIIEVFLVCAIHAFPLRLCQLSSF